jgi:hypothetical protein
MAFLAGLALIAAFGVRAAERYAANADLFARADAYSRAARLPSLGTSKGDELRVWTYGFMSPRGIDGFVISRHGSLKCRTRYDHEDGVMTIAAARCRRWHKGMPALASLDGLALLNGKEWSCPMLDGGGVLIEGVRNGKRFAMEVGNPDACDDKDSELVEHLLAELR